MRVLFSLNSIYRTHLSQEEVSARIDELIRRKSKFLFFTFHQYFGTISGNQFILTRQRFDVGGAMSSRLKGSIINDDGTVIRTRITIPWLIVTFFGFVTLISLFAILGADEITVNGERSAEFLDKILIALVALAFPGCMIFFVSVLPAKLMERKLVKILGLKE